MWMNGPLHPPDSQRSQPPTDIQTTNGEAASSSTSSSAHSLSHGHSSASSTLQDEANSVVTYADSHSLEPSPSPPQGDLSDDQDLADEDGGAPLVNYLDIANIVNADVTLDTDMDHHQSEAEAESDIDLASGAEIPGHVAQMALATPPGAPYLHQLAVPQPTVGVDLVAPPPYNHPENLLQLPVSPPNAIEHAEPSANEDADGPPWINNNPWGAAIMNVLIPENPGLFPFLRIWAQHGGPTHNGTRIRGRFPALPQTTRESTKSVPEVQYSDLEGDRWDFQGIDWETLGVTRRDGRKRRLDTYRNYVNKENSDDWKPGCLDVLPCSESFFRFRRMDIRRDVKLYHFQLRNTLASISRSQAFYTGDCIVHEFNPITGKRKLGMAGDENPVIQVSTLTAGHGVLMAGGFGGEYCMRRLASDIEGESARVHEGTITPAMSGITNHVQVHLSRSSAGPKAAFASNDNGFRVLDVETEKFISDWVFEDPINCSAISPDRRMRVMVGDQRNVLITAAETQRRPEILQSLSGHRDYGFACDWADDGWTVATGFQDKAIMIWDARRWTDSKGQGNPVCKLRAEMAGARSLRFSPVGSGKRVLVAAEEADYINIIDAQTFRSKQTLDIFGEIGGVSFVNDGQDLHVLCSDQVRGGLIQLERCGLGAEAYHEVDGEMMTPREMRWRGNSFDWPQNPTTPRRTVARHSIGRWRRQALDDPEPL